MADNSALASTSTSDPIHLPYSLSIPSSFRRTQSSKIENLVEYSYVPEEAQIQSTNQPFINPYNIYRRDSSIKRSIRSLISTRRPHAKEYVQTSKMDQCSLRATSAEHLEDAKSIIDLVQGIPCNINLIQFNPHKGSQFRPTSREKMIEFRNTLAAGKCVVFMRDSRGDDQMAACGQLVGRTDKVFEQWDKTIGRTIKSCHSFTKVEDKKIPLLY